MVPLGHRFIVRKMVFLGHRFGAFQKATVTFFSLSAGMGFHKALPDQSRKGKKLSRSGISIVFQFFLLECMR